ncbi:MAG: DNA adenine methylase [Blastocatellia bacterium]|nr:DNA adenine methylase [Blastocatellia bacterium]
MNRRSDLTFKHNLKHGRHGWLRLTPAYSIKVVREILDEHPAFDYVLDPFSGTGTTGLVCGERGLRCDLLDINPFLVWFAGVKTSNFTPDELLEAKKKIRDVLAASKEYKQQKFWLPPIKDIDRWWPESCQNFLSRIYKAINESLPENSPAKDIFLVAFCRCLMQWSNAAFNHQSMSFKERKETLFDHQERDLLASSFERNVEMVIDSAAQRIEGEVRVILADSRQVPEPADKQYDCVITSPPYPNRMSYIRELRPYMYWLGYLKEAREAGELDWQAIGGTWGIATSRLSNWKPNGREIMYSGFQEIITGIADESTLLANYTARGMK